MNLIILLTHVDVEFLFFQHKSLIFVMKSSHILIRFFCFEFLFILLNLNLVICKITSRKLIPHDVEFLEVLMPKVKPSKVY